MRTGQLLGIALATTLMPSALYAQSILREPLEGLKTLGILIENLSQNAQACGITKDGMETSLRLIVRQSGIQIARSPDSRDAKDGFIYLAVTALENCTTSVSLEVASLANIAATGRSVTATIWERRGVRVGGNANANTKAMVEAFAKQLADDWNLANK